MLLVPRLLPDIHAVPELRVEHLSLAIRLTPRDAEVASWLEKYGYSRPVFARYGEWQMSDHAVPEIVGPET